MFDGPTQSEGDYAVKAASPSPLAQLIDTQEQTKKLLSILGEKLAPVSNPHPVESRDRLNGGYHIHTALGTQQEINEAISYIIDTVIV